MINPDRFRPHGSYLLEVRTLMFGLYECGNLEMLFLGGDDKNLL